MRRTCFFENDSFRSSQYPQQQQLHPPFNACKTTLYTSSSVALSGYSYCNVVPGRWRTPSERNEQKLKFFHLSSQDQFHLLVILLLLLLLQDIKLIDMQKSGTSRLVPNLSPFLSGGSINSHLSSILLTAVFYGKLLFPILPPFNDPKQKYRFVTHCKKLRAI